MTQPPSLRSSADFETVACVSQSILHQPVYSIFRLDEEARCRSFSPHPVPLPQGEREPKNDLFIQMQTAISYTPYCPSLPAEVAGAQVLSHLTEDDARDILFAADGKDAHIFPLGGRLLEVQGRGGF